MMHGQEYDTGHDKIQKNRIRRHVKQYFIIIIIIYR